MDIIRLKAMAKINLGLDVLRKRPDGYHEVKMVMQTISLHDKIEIKKTRHPEIVLRTNLGYLPTNESNLAYSAAKMLKEEFNLPGGIFIHLHKYIPVSAGMAGGSTDCAAVLFGINQMYQLGLNRKKLMERGVKLGADVPYCIMRGTALSEGIGEILTPLPPMPACKILIAKPNINVSTKWVYNTLDANNLQQHPNIDALIMALKEGNLHNMTDYMENVLEHVTIAKYPVIDAIKTAMLELGAMHAMMSGSGPTVFGLFENTSQLEFASQKLRKMDLASQIYMADVFNNRSKV